MRFTLPSPAIVLPAAIPALALGAASLLSAPALIPGDKLPTPELEGFSQTGAESYDDYTGRAVLIEFFEYW